MHVKYFVNLLINYYDYFNVYHFKDLNSNYFDNLHIKYFVNLLINYYDYFHVNKDLNSN